MARAVSNKAKVANTAIAGTLGFLVFFPILWILILSFKTEEDAIRAPLEILFSSAGRWKASVRFRPDLTISSISPTRSSFQSDLRSSDF